MSQPLEPGHFITNCVDASCKVLGANRQKFRIRGCVVVALNNMFHGGKRSTTLMKDVHDDEANLIASPIKVHAPLGLF